MAFIRIDPAHPVVWRSPRSLQIGGDSPLAVFEPLTARDERMLAAARSGIPSEALAAVGGCGPADVRAFLDRVRPALAGPAPERVAVAVRVNSAARIEIVRTARMLGLAAPAAAGRPRIGVIVADHAVPLRAYRDWMREGVQHFAVVFGTARVAIGPLVVPGETGCLRCADLRRLDADPAWPAVAAQLVDLPAAAALDAVLRTEALCAAARLADAVGAGAAVPAGQEPIEPHPDCGCRLDLQLELPPPR